MIDLAFLSEPLFWFLFAFFAPIAWKIGTIL